MSSSNLSAATVTSTYETGIHYLQYKLGSMVNVASSTQYDKQHRKKNISLFQFFP